MYNAKGDFLPCFLYKLLGKSCSGYCPLGSDQIELDMLIKPFGVDVHEKECFPCDPKSC